MWVVMMGGERMRKKTIPILIGGISVYALLNVMRFILRSTSISRITCNSFDEAIAQNCYSLMSIGFSIVAILILLRYYKKEIQEAEE